MPWRHKMRKFRMMVMLVVIAAGGFSVTGCSENPVSAENCTDPNGIAIRC
jgi:hypothetical protein